MPRPLATLTLAAMALLAAPSAAQAQDTVSRRDRFELFNACRPMGLVIEDLSDHAATIGLTRVTLQAAAESRLRVARLYSNDYTKTNHSYLYVNVNVVRASWNIFVQYNKVLTDEFGVSGASATWYIGSNGTHGGDAGYIVSSLSQHLDEFLADYLRVNEAACKAR